MKLLLLISVVCFALALAAPADKQKREILPGDPRYGTDHHHHHHHHENEVEILKAVGGYVGSYTVPDDTEDHSFQVPQTSYGPPSYKAGKPLGSDYLAPNDAIKSSTILQVPSTSYGVPDTTQVLNNNYLAPVIEDKKSELIKVHNLNTEHQLSTVEAPVTSFTSVKHEEHVPHTSYGVPSKQPLLESVQKTVIPKVLLDEVHHVQQEQPTAVIHKHVETVPQQAVSVSQTKLTTSQLPVQTQGVIQHSSVPSFGSYPGYTSYSSIPVRTVDHHVHVQVPQPYPVPVTKQVTYPFPVPHAVEVPKPYYVRVPQPVQVTVNRPYPVEIPRPVPYPVPQYIRTSVPVIQGHQVNVETKANPLQELFDNAQSTFQNVLGNFQNPLHVFDNLELPSLPSLPSLPTLPSVPFVPQQTQTVAPIVDLSVPATTDSVTIDNPTLKTTVTKTAITQPAITTHHTKTIHVPSTIKDSTCIGCAISASNEKKEYVQPTDANGGYIY